MPGPPNREGSPTPQGAAPGVHNPAPAPGPAPAPAATPTPIPTATPTGAPVASDRRSLQLVLVAVLVGVALAVTGAGQAWARVGAAVELPGLGSARLGSAEVTGNDLAPLGALALLGLVLLVGVAVTRGRGRWAVGVALLVLGAALAVQAVAGATGIEAEAAGRARSGELEGVPGGSSLQVRTSPAGPGLVVAGGLLLAAAGAEALRRGPSWPVLGDAFRAPPDRAQPAPDPAEPPWEGD